MLRTGMLAAVTLVLLAGCGGDGRPELAPVTGVVKYKGAPLAEGTIVFLPANGRSAEGKIVNGAITDVTTYDPNDGAPIGDHTVTIFAITNAKDYAAEHKSLIPAKYSDPKKSGLTAKVQAGGPNEITLDLTDVK